MPTPDFPLPHPPTDPSFDATFARAAERAFRVAEERLMRIIELIYQRLHASLAREVIQRRVMDQIGVVISLSEDTNTIVALDFNDIDVTQRQCIQMYLALTDELGGFVLDAINHDLREQGHPVLTVHDIREYEVENTPEIEESTQS